MERPLPDQLDIIHTECMRHMRVLDFDELTGNFLVGCDACKLQLIVQKFIPQSPEKVEDVPIPEVERITAESDPKTDYVPKKHLKK